MKGSNPWCLWSWSWSWSFTTSYSPIAPTSDFEVIWVTQSCLSSVKKKWAKGVFGEVYKVGLHVSCGLPIPSRYTACPKSRCTGIILSFLYRASFQHMEWKPTDVTILLVYCWVSTCFGPTGPSSGEFVQLFTQPLFQYLYRSGRVLCMYIQSTRTERCRYWTNGCVNSCTNSPEDGPVGPKHVETQQYTNKIVTSVGFHSIRWKDARYKKA